MRLFNKISILDIPVPEVVKRLRTPNSLPFKTLVSLKINLSFGRRYCVIWLNLLSRIEFSE